MNGLILCTTEDGKSQIQMRVDLGTVCHTKLEQPLDSVVNQRLTAVATRYQRPAVKDSFAAQERFV